MKRKRALILVAFLLMLYITPMSFISSYGGVAIPAQQNIEKDFMLSSETLVYSSSGTAGDSAINAHTDTHTVNDVEYIGDSTGTSCYVTLNFTIPAGVDGFNYYTQTDWNLVGDMNFYVYNWDTDTWTYLGSIGTGPFTDTWKNGSINNPDYIGETQVALRWYQGEGTGLGLVSVDYASIGWYTTEWYNSSWLYRKNVTVTGSAGAGTNYQIRLNVTHSARMQSDFDDLRFTAVDGVTLWDYWIEAYTVSTIAYVWVEVRDSLETNVVFWMYYGNSAVSTTSSGPDTFNAFFDKNNITGWTLSNIAVSTSGDFLRFYNPTAGDGGEAQRWDITTPADFQMMSQYKTVSLGAADQGTFILGDASVSHRFGQVYTPLATQQAKWYYYDGAAKEGGDWTEGTEFIFTIQVDEGDSGSGTDYRRYDTSWSLLDSQLGEGFPIGTPTDCDGIYLGDASAAATIDVYFRWIAFRKCIDSPPVFDSFGDEEPLYPPVWQSVGVAELIFHVEWDPAAQFGYDAFFIFLGLIMIPASTLYLVRGGRKEMSTDKLFYGLIIFFVGVGLLIGGIIP